MLTFLLFTVIFWAGSAAIARVLYFSIQQGQWLDRLFGWQAMLAKLYEGPQRWKADAGKVLGDCRMCFGHFIVFLSYWAYYIFCKISLGLWVTDGMEGWVSIGFTNTVWYMLFVCIGTVLNFSLTASRKR